MDVEGEEAGVFEEEVAAYGYCERDGEVKAECEVAVERVSEADGLGVGGVAVGVEGEETVEGWGLRGHGVDLGAWELIQIKCWYIEEPGSFAGITVVEVAIQKSQLFAAQCYMYCSNACDGWHWHVMGDDITKSAGSSTLSC